MIHHEKERKSRNNSHPNKKGYITPGKITKEYSKNVSAYQCLSIGKT